MITRHILPNVMHIVLIALVMDFSGLVLAEAVLSYVGVGVDPSTTSFGTMINAARLEMAREPMVWWALAAAFVFMFVLVLAANLFADAVRDGFDPRVAVGRAWARRHEPAGPPQGEPRARSREGPMSANLLEARDLRTELEASGGIVRALDGVDLDRAAGRDVRDRRRVGLRQEHDGAHADAPPARDRPRRLRQRPARTAPSCSRSRRRACATCAGGAWR